MSAMTEPSFLPNTPSSSDIVSIQFRPSAFQINKICIALRSLGRQISKSCSGGSGASLYGPNCPTGDQTCLIDEFFS